MRKSKYVRWTGDYKVEIDLPDGTTIIVTPAYISYGHNDRGIGLTIQEKKDVQSVLHESVSQRIPLP